MCGQIAPDIFELDIGHPHNRRQHAQVGERDRVTGQPLRAFRDCGVDSLNRLAQSLDGFVHLILRKAVGAETPIMSLAQRRRCDVAGAHLVAHPAPSVEKQAVERRHANRRGWYLFDVAQPRANSRAPVSVARHQRSAVARSNLLEVLADHRGIDDGSAVVHQRRHDAVGIEREICGGQVRAGREFDRMTGPSQALLGQAQADLLTARRNMRVI